MHETAYSYPDALRIHVLRHETAPFLTSGFIRVKYWAGLTRRIVFANPIQRGKTGPDDQHTKP